MAYTEDRAGRPWTPEEITFVRTSSLPTHEVARRLRRPYTAVRLRRFREKTRMPPPSETLLTREQTAAIVAANPSIAINVDGLVLLGLPVINCGLCERQHPSDHVCDEPVFRARLRLAAEADGSN